MEKERNKGGNIEQMKVTYKNIRDLKPYKKNAKKHPKEQVEQIANSIKKFGFTQPVLIDKHNCVVAGHGRILGAKKAGLKEVPTVCLDELTEEQIKAYRLADNKLNESDWDFGLLDEELGVLADDIDMSLFGFDLDMTDEEDEPKKPKYTMKTNAPVYEIRGDKPQLTDLFNMTKTKKLIKDIEKSSVSEREKKFLKMAAYRHCVFDYGKIAEYYAHASEEMQKLMEDNALIIIDYDRAYELGYVKMMKKLTEMNEDDEETEKLF